MPEDPGWDFERGTQMRYMGSKSRIAEHIVPIIHQRLDDYGLKKYIEPFVGGANIIDKIQCQERIGADKQQYLIEIYRNLEKLEEMPEFITREHYSEVRKAYNEKSGAFPDWYIGMVGFLASYNGRFFDGGYAGLVKTKEDTIRNYYAEAKRNLQEQIPKLQGIEWRCGDYREVCEGLEDYVIYCDIPYFGTKQYNASRGFDHEAFWQWAEMMSEKNVVLVSESIAPKHWECIWEQPIKRTINNRNHIDRAERLFEVRD